VGGPPNPLPESPGSFDAWATLLRLTFNTNFIYFLTRKYILVIINLNSKEV